MLTSCIACGRNFELFGTTGGVLIFRCSNCGLGASHSEGVNVGYKRYHRDPVYKVSKEQFLNIFQKRVGIISRFIKGSRALEIGSSTGLLLYLLTECGWDVLGVEPSKEAVGTAEKMGIETLNETFESAKLQLESFDLVVLNHTLEHMRDPLAVLGKARKILKKNGLIFIDVPNFGSFTARLMGTKWSYILPKEHYWHFTKDSLFRILEKSGFASIHWEAHSGIWGYGNPLLEVWQSFTGGKKRFFMNVLTAIPAFILTLLKFGTGLTVVAQKE